MIYEITEEGFDGGSDATDDLVHWIDAPSEAAVRLYATKRGWVLGSGPTLMEHQDLGPEDGVDCVIDAAGEIRPNPVL